jgi:RNA polymerase sigma-70 factor (ECF subfamily)
MVLAAGHGAEPAARHALEELCQAYWPPLFSFIRRQGYTPHDAQDLTQGFFAWLLASHHLGVADPERGKFRSFLLIRLKHFLSDERKRAHAQKRGGGQPILSLEAGVAEGEERETAASDLTPEQVFDRRWAFMVLERSVARLRQEYAAADRIKLFELLRYSSMGESDGPAYADAAAALGLTESAVKSAAHRLRQRHRQLLREEIAQTVAAPADIDEELRYLISVISR